ncbi:MAG: EpsG family protein, partial [Capnocytophaga sp.]|nr:EpsG family protein [Capnocytophaga sp.]
YVTIFIFFVFFSFIEIFTKQKNIAKYLFIFSCLLLFILSFIRWKTGTDWDNYQTYFEGILYKPYANDSFEPGFRAINYIARSISKEYTISLFFSGIILFTFQSLGIVKFSIYPMTSLTFLYASQLANILFVRQWIAVAILFYSIKFIRDNKFWQFLLLVLLATTIHRSAIVFVLAWWIYQNWISFKKMLIVLASSIVFSYLLHYLLQSLLGSFGGAVIQHKLEKYLSDSYNEELNEQMNFTLILIKGIANKLVVLLGSMYIYGKLKEEDKFFRGLINIYWLGCVIYFVTISISLALVRFSFAFDIVQIILITYILSHFSNIRNRGIIFAVLLAYAALRLFTFLNSPYQDEFVPYKHITIF